MWEEGERHTSETRLLEDRNVRPVCEGQSFWLGIMPPGLHGLESRHLTNISVPIWALVSAMEIQASTAPGPATTLEKAHISQPAHNANGCSMSTSKPEFQKETSFQGDPQKSRTGKHTTGTSIS